MTVGELMKIKELFDAGMDITDVNKEMNKGKKEVSDKRPEYMTAKERVDSLDAVGPSWQEYLLDAGFDIGSEVAHGTGDVFKDRGSMLAKVLLANSRLSTPEQEAKYGVDLISNAMQGQAAKQEYLNNMYANIANRTGNVIDKTRTRYDTNKAAKRDAQQKAILATNNAGFWDYSRAGMKAAEAAKVEAAKAEGGKK